ncbi:MAG: GIY-YIG nuclease family protein [Rickettsiales bacterium]|nr:GIY-YIG nuclease family protein [Rickettsiales bacterium]
MQDKGGFVYIMTSRRNGTLYTGVTSNLEQRFAKHKIKYYKTSFTAKHNVHILVYYEHFPTIESAIKREKQIKDWNRNWKKDLIEKSNPNWRNLADDLFSTGTVI